MLKSSNPISKLNAVSPNSFAVMVGVVMSSELAFPFINGFLKLKSNLDLFFFDDDILLDATQKCCSKRARNAPRMLGAMYWISQAVIVAVAPAPKSILEQVNYWFMCHTNKDVKLHSWVAFFANHVIEGSNPNAALTVEQTCNISNVEFHRALAEKSANSVDTQNGQYRAKQDKSPGVCREHVPTPKGKICSDLHRNMQRLAEMTG